MVKAPSTLIKDRVDWNLQDHEKPSIIFYTNLDKGKAPETAKSINIKEHAAECGPATMTTTAGASNTEVLRSPPTIQ